MSGRTSNFVERLTILTYSGEVLDVGATAEAELEEILRGGGRRAAIYSRLCALRDRYGELIEEKYPQIPRRVSGFENLDALLPGRGFNVARALTGTEGTCAIILDATLRLVPSPPCRAVAILGYDDICAAADSVPDLLRDGPIALEGFDDLLYGFVEKGEAEDAGLRFFPEGKGWLIAEFAGDSPAEAEDKARRIANGAEWARVIADPREQHLVWAAREKALGSTAFVPGAPDTWPG